MASITWTQEVQNSPYNVLERFTTNSQELEGETKKDVFNLLEDCFSNLLLTDQPKPMPKNMRERFSDIAKKVWDLGISIDNSYTGELRTKRLLAMIAKVDGTAKLTLNEPWSVVQLVTGKKGEEYWGWLDATFVQNSLKLLEKCSDGVIRFDDGSMSPTALFALNRWPFCSGDSEKKTLRVPLSISATLELFKFAVEWDVHPLIGQVTNVLAQTDKQELEEAAAGYDQEFKDRIQFQGYKPENTLKIIWPSDEVVSESSRYFQETLYRESLKKLLYKGSAMLGEEPQRFLADLRRFFESSVFFDRAILQSNTFEAKVLPLLVNNPGMWSKGEHQRFLGNVSSAISQVVQWPNSDKLIVIQNHVNTIVQQGWLKFSGEEPEALKLDKRAGKLVHIRHIDGYCELEFDKLCYSSHEYLGLLKNPVETYLTANKYGIESWKKRAEADMKVSPEWAWGELKSWLNNEDNKTVMEKLLEVQLDPAFLSCMESMKTFADQDSLKFFEAYYQAKKEQEIAKLPYSELVSFLIKTPSCTVPELNEKLKKTGASNANKEDWQKMTAFFERGDVIQLFAILNMEQARKSALDSLKKNQKS